MPLPNLLIVGSQKSGTSWLHRSLGMSEHVFASEVKELDHFNQLDFGDPHKIKAFSAHFETPKSVRYRLESTPHYFQLPKGRIDTARNIQALLGSPKLIAIFRNPVDRYESAYIHHVMKGRLRYTPEIDRVVTDHGLVSLGRYAEILTHWWSVHPNLKPMLHDDLEAAPVAFVTEVMEYLDLNSDLDRDQLHFRSNDKAVKRSSLGLRWETMPALSSRVRGELHETYRDGVLRLQDMLERDLGHWLSGAS